MDLRWQIQHSEKNWNREKVELLDRLDRDRREWERQKKELLRRIEQVRSRLWSWGGQWLAASMRYYIITALRPRSRNSSKEKYFKEQHRSNFGSLDTSVFPKIQNNSHTRGSKGEMLIIPIKPMRNQLQVKGHFLLHFHYPGQARSHWFILFESFCASLRA